MTILGQVATGGSSGETAMVQLAQQLEVQLDMEGFFLQLTSQFNIELTPGAYLMLLIPLVEANVQADSGTILGAGVGNIPRLDRQSVEASLSKLVAEIAESPVSTDQQIPPQGGMVSSKTRRVRSSLSVIRAFWKHFCDIPPFCDQTGR